MKIVLYRQKRILFVGLILLIQTLFLASTVAARDSSNVKPYPFGEEINFPQGSIIFTGSTQLARVNGPLYQLQAYLKADDVTSGDKFGHAAAIDEDTLLIGAPGEDSGGSNSGAAYVFVRSGLSWVQQATLKASNADFEDHFGIAVDIDGDTIVVGADGEDSGSSNPDDNSTSGAGAAYVFIRDGEDWTPQGYLKAEIPQADDEFGEAVAVDGDRIVVGAYNADKAYVFKRSVTTWAQQDDLEADNNDSGDSFGCSVAISGDTVVVGAEHEDGSDVNNPGDNSKSSSGAAYVFVSNTEGIWSQQAYLKASNAGEGDNFGYSVSISGELILVGAPHEESNGSNPEDDSLSGAGAAYVFQQEGTSWTQEAYLKALNVEKYDNFGHAVAIDGNTLAVSAIGKEDSGAVYVFSLEGSNWSQQAYLRASNSDAEDGFGTSNGLDISGETILVGADYEDGDGSDPEDNSALDAGAAYVFQKACSATYLPLIIR